METKTKPAQDNDTIPVQRELSSRESDSRQRLWDVLVRRLGRRYEHAKLNNFVVSTPAQKSIIELTREYLTDLKHRVEEGQSVLFFGPPGTGKDHILTAMMRVAINKGCIVKWRDGSEMFGEFRDSIRGEASEGNLIENYTSRADILAISDPVPPFGGLTPYQSSMFFRIIDRRYRDMQPTWITINAADRKEAEDRMGASIVDRLGENALSLPCNWQSYRQESAGLATEKTKP